MVAIEVIHYISTKPRKKDGCVVLKLDISKAYNKIDWLYSREVMLNMGFSDTWVQWISLCVESVDYYVLVNGEPVGPVIPGRGLRQGDPLSPYLFILCAEGLSSLIRPVEDRREITAEVNQAHKMKAILTLYEAASGQAISLPKFEIYCSRNVPDGLKTEITNILGVRSVLGTWKYLGLPSMIGRDKNLIFAYIKDRVWQRINSWSSKCLSKAGKEVMIKSVLQAIPSYVMSIFHLPTMLINTIEKTMHSFWWGHGGGNNRGINLMSWERLAVHKSHGGMGFKNLSTFNLAMLGKKGWKFLTEPTSLVTRIFKARYFPTGTYLTTKVGHNPSYVWRSIMRARFIVRGGARWSIGSGNSIPILDEPWLINGKNIASSIPGAHFVSGCTVADFIDNTTKCWNSASVNQVFSSDIAVDILRTPLVAQVPTDRLIWKAEKTDLYSVRNAYRLCVEELVDVSHLHRPCHWSGIWKLKVPPKVKNLIWRICRGCLPTRARLQDKGVNCPTNCVSCVELWEDVAHVFFECPFAAQVWRMAGLWNEIQRAVNSTTYAADVIFSILHDSSIDLTQRVAALIWSIWMHRNIRLWQNEDDMCAQVVERAKVLIEEWQLANMPSEHGSQQHGNRDSHASTSGEQVRWKKPLPGRLKCNVDATFSSVRNQTGIGICLRDDEGAFMLAKTISLSPECPIDVGEVLALHHALDWMQDMEFDNIDFVVDSKTTSDAIQPTRVDVSEFGQIIAGCRNLLSTHFTNSRMEFSRRQANVVAHELAREATRLASPNIYFDIPNCIDTHLMNDML